jgi:hypothetical protein
MGVARQVRRYSRQVPITAFVQPAGRPEASADSRKTRPGVRHELRVVSGHFHLRQTRRTLHLRSVFLCGEPGLDKPIPPYRAGTFALFSTVSRLPP